MTKSTLTNSFATESTFKLNFKQLLTSLTKHIGLQYRSLVTMQDNRGIKVKCAYSDDLYTVISNLNSPTFEVADDEGIIREFKLIARKAGVDTMMNGDTDRTGKPILRDVNFSHIQLKEFKPSEPISADDICSQL